MKHVRRYSHLTTCSEQMRGICGTTHAPCHPPVHTSLEFHWIVHGERIPENLAAPVDAMTRIIFLLTSLSQWTSRHLFCPEFQKIDHTISHSECWHYSLCIVSILPAVYGHILLGLFGQFLFQYKNNRTYRISIPKRTDFVLFWKQNSWRDKHWRKSGYAIFPLKDRRKLPKEHDYRLFCLFQTNRYSIYSINSTIRSRIDGILFCSFQNQNRSQRTQLPPILCILILE